MSKNRSEDSINSCMKLEVMANSFRGKEFQFYVDFNSALFSEHRPLFMYY